MEEVKFKIIRQLGRGDAPSDIPWEMVAPHNKQAIINHGQSLSALNKRGGLSVVELWHVMNDKDWKGGPKVGFTEALEWLHKLVDK